MKKIFIFLILATTINFTSCAQKQEQAVQVPQKEVLSTPENAEVVLKDNITPAELKQVLTSKKEVVIIDVRTPREIAEGKIENAMEINISDPSFEEKIKALDPSKEYVVYCKVGGRSARAQQVMKSIGISKVSNLVGGYDNYKTSGQ